MHNEYNEMKHHNEYNETFAAQPQYFPPYDTTCNRFVAAGYPIRRSGGSEPGRLRSDMQFLLATLRLIKLLHDQPRASGFQSHLKYAIVA